MRMAIEMAEALESPSRHMSTAPMLSSCIFGRYSKSPASQIVHASNYASTSPDDSSMVTHSATN